MKEIVNIMLAGIGKRTERQMNLSLSVSEEAKAFLVEKGYDEKYGARRCAGQFRIIWRISWQKRFSTEQLQPETRFA